MESQVELAEKMVRFMKHLPSGADHTLVVLKGHLLIEELLTELLKEKLNRNNPLRIKIDSNAMFAQKLNLCWAIVQGDIKFEIWTFLKELNSIRNKMAHSVEPQGISEKIEAFTKMVSSHEHYLMPKSRDCDLEFSIAWLHIILSQYLHHVKNS